MFLFFNVHGEHYTRGCALSIRKSRSRSSYFSRSPPPLKISRYEILFFPLSLSMPPPDLFLLSMELEWNYTRRVRVSLQTTPTSSYERLHSTRLSPFYYLLFVRLSLKCTELCFFFVFFFLFSPAVFTYSNVFSNRSARLTVSPDFWYLRDNRFFTVCWLCVYLVRLWQRFREMKFPISTAVNRKLIDGNSSTCLPMEALYINGMEIIYKLYINEMEIVYKLPMEA